MTVAGRGAGRRVAGQGVAGQGVAGQGVANRRGSGVAAPPRLLTIAGSDSGGGAGIQADLKTFAAHGGFGMSVLTAVTAQNTLGVDAVHVLPPAMVAAQLDAVLGDIGVDAVKIGMLADAGIVAAVAARLRAHGLPGAAPVVLDPVMVAASGDPLLAADAVAAIVSELLPLATVVTPNLPEAERLSGLPAGTEAERRLLALALAAAGPAVLIKGGHDYSADELVDLLLEAGEFRSFRHPRQATKATHGTGCTLAAALAARLGRGESMAEAAAGAVAYLQEAMAAAYPVGAGRGPVDPFLGWRGVA